MRIVPAGSAPLVAGSQTNGSGELTQLAMLLPFSDYVRLKRGVSAYTKFLSR